MGSQRVGYDLATEHCIAKQKLVVGEGRRGRDERQSTEDFEGSETVLCDTAVVNTCHCTFVKIHRTQHRVNPNVNYGFGK